MVVTARDTRIGFALLFLVIALLAVALVFWQHLTGMSITHLLLSFTTLPQVGIGC